MRTMQLDASGNQSNCTSEVSLQDVKLNKCLNTMYYSQKPLHFIQNFLLCLLTSPSAVCM